MSKSKSNGASNYNQVALLTNQVNALKQVIRTHSIAAQRQRSLGALGQQFDGKRDVNTAAGYKTDIQFDDYLAKYNRQDVAHRIIDAPAIATWRVPPEIKDGDEGDTPFTEAWSKLTDLTTGNVDNDVDDIEDQKSIWHYCQRADSLSGIGHYGVMLLGINDGQDLKQPLMKGDIGTEGLLYLSTYDEGVVEITELGSDSKSRRYNLPIKYKIKVSDMIGGKVTSNPTMPEVHWSRVVHIAEGLKSNEIYGTPRLKAVYNRLDDLEKVMAATGEAAWRLMQKGFIFSSQDGYDLPDDTSDLENDIEQFIHELNRTLMLEGIDTTVLGGEVVDPSGVIKAIISIISGMTGIPQRILLGSEAGQLASSQDERNWAQRITARKVQFAEPQILRPLINRLIFAGVLPPPSSGNYQVVWPNSIELSELEMAQVEQAQAAGFASAVSGGMPAEVYLRHVWGWDDSQIDAYYEALERQENFALMDFVTGIEQ